MIKRIMIILFSILFVLLLPGIVFSFHPKFGRTPSGTRLARIEKSPNYRDGAFRNLSETPVLVKDVNHFEMFREFFFSNKPRKKPHEPLPAVKLDLKQLDPTQNLVVWLGHSSYLMQIDGKKFLVDPVMSGSASPVSFTTKAFPGSDPYQPSDLPEIDYLVITHDHWDHLDYETIMQLKPKIKEIICGLGVGEHFVKWHFDEAIIHESDWGDTTALAPGFTIHTRTARHFSGRMFLRNRSLWASFVLVSPTQKIFVGGDGGYDTHFASIGKEFNGIDLAILENGQYDPRWRYIHMLPEEGVQAALDLQAQRVLPVHSAKFILSVHPWDEPLERYTALSINQKFQLLTPLIGDTVNLADTNRVFTQWWKSVP